MALRSTHNSASTLQERLAGYEGPLAVLAAIALVAMLGLTGAITPILCTVDKISGGNSETCQDHSNDKTPDLGAGGLPAATNERLVSTDIGEEIVNPDSGVILVSGKTGDTFSAQIQRLVSGPLQTGTWWDGSGQSDGLPIDGQRENTQTPACGHQDEPSCDTWEDLRDDAQDSGKKSTGVQRLALAGLDPLIDVKDQATTTAYELTVPQTLTGAEDAIIPVSAKYTTTAHSKDGSITSAYLLTAFTTLDEGALEKSVSKNSTSAIFWEVERNAAGRVTALTAHRAVANPTAAEPTAILMTTIELDPSVDNAGTLDRILTEVTNQGVPVLPGRTWYPTISSEDPLVNLLYEEGQVTQVIAAPKEELTLAQAVTDISWLDEEDTTVVSRAQLGEPNAIGARSFEQKDD